MQLDTPRPYSARPPPLAVGAVGSGQRFSRYQIVETLQRGGMGEVVLAEVEDPSGWRSRVVLKRLLADLLEDERYVTMFLSEAQIMARLNHPNIVKLYDLPIIAGKQCLALEYVHGKNVYQMMKRCRALGIVMPPRVALHVVCEIARGLHYAHELALEDGRPLELVHRDVTPGNLLVSFDGDVKITDFGISKSKMSMLSTTVGVVKGTTRYLSPEQIRGQGASPRSDLYSAALVLVEMMTGRAVFDRSTVPAVIFAIAADQRPRMTELFPRLEYARLADVLERALSSDPQRRQANAEEFRIELEEAGELIGARVDRASTGAFVRDLFPEHHEPLGAFEVAESNATGLDNQDLTYLFEIRDPIVATDEVREAQKAMREMEMGSKPLDAEQFRPAARSPQVPTEVQRLPRSVKRADAGGGDDAGAIHDAFAEDRSESGPLRTPLLPFELAPPSEDEEATEHAKAPPRTPQARLGSARLEQMPAYGPAERASSSAGSEAAARAVSAPRGEAAARSASGARAESLPTARSASAPKVEPLASGRSTSTQLEEVLPPRSTTANDQVTRSMGPSSSGSHEAVKRTIAPSSSSSHEATSRSPGPSSSGSHEAVKRTIAPSSSSSHEAIARSPGPSSGSSHEVLRRTIAPSSSSSHDALSRPPPDVPARPTPSSSPHDVLLRAPAAPMPSSNPHLEFLSRSTNTPLVASLAAALAAPSASPQPQPHAVPAPPATTPLRRLARGTILFALGIACGIGAMKLTTRSDDDPRAPLAQNEAASPAFDPDLDRDSDTAPRAPAAPALVEGELCEPNLTRLGEDLDPPPPQGAVVLAAAPAPTPAPAKAKLPKRTKSKRAHKRSAR